MDAKSLIHTEVLKDKSMWMALAVPALVMLANLFGKPLDTETAQMMIGLAATFIVSSKAKQALVGRSVAANNLSESLKAIDKALEEPKSE